MYIIIMICGPDTTWEDRLPVGKGEAETGLEKDLARRYHVPPELEECGGSGGAHRIGTCSAAQSVTPLSRRV